MSDPRQNIPSGLAFNPAAFVAPPPGQFGNIGRNTLRGDRYLNTDFALLRNFRFTPLGEAGAIEFRAEAFNVYNQTNFIFPVSSLSNGDPTKIRLLLATSSQVSWLLRLNCGSRRLASRDL